MHPRGNSIRQAPISRGLLIAERRYGKSLRSKRHYKGLIGASVPELGSSHKVKHEQYGTICRSSGGRLLSAGAFEPRERSYQYLPSWPFTAFHLLSPLECIWSEGDNVNRRAVHETWRLTDGTIPRERYRCPLKSLSCSPVSSSCRLSIQSEFE